MGNSNCNDEKKVELDPRDSPMQGTALDLTNDFLKYERRMIEHSGIPYEEFKIYNIKVDEEGNTVRTFEVGIP
jgi:hypothetical protein